ncbi:transposase, partial [Endomicrobium sp. AH-315-J14]|nr:transposase [Endomicrobium sp. AH-315-J14]
ARGRRGGTEPDFFAAPWAASRQELGRHAKRPFGGPEQVRRYLARYTHRVAISKARLLANGPDGVRFRTRGDDTATAPAREFLSRFFQPRPATELREDPSLRLACFRQRRRWDYRRPA